jgi:hypothetical protein
MKNWWVPATLLGLSGLGLFCTSDRGREQIRSVLDRLARHGDPLGEVSDFLDDQLAAMQRTLDAVAEALDQQRA